MAEHGGQRTPNDPAAAVSGPGALSARTDGGATQAPQVAAGNGYGERKAMMDLQSARLAGRWRRYDTPPCCPPSSDPTARPDEPPTQIDDSTRERLLSALPVLMPGWLPSRRRASRPASSCRQVRGDL
jgi:hypothetical protein